jgi:hypothetical protein
VLLDVLHRQRTIERACYAIGAALVVAGLAHLLPALAFPRPWDGPLSWRKAVTFGTSFGTVLISLTWVPSYLRMSERRRTILLSVFAADSVVEVVGISIQAWRHVPSHFNTVGPLNATIGFSLAVGGAVLVATLGSFAVVALRGSIDALPPMRLALRAGFAFLLAGLASGIAMIVRGEQLLRSGSPGIAYATAGYLKWVHAITLHALLVLPSLAWLLARSRWSEARQRSAVLATVALYLAAALMALVISIARS